MYSIATFVLLALSIMMFFLNSFSEFSEQTLRALYDQDTLVVIWFEDHATLIRVLRSIFRIFIGYLCQNLAFLVNIERWLVILQQGNKRAFKTTIYVLILNALFLSSLSMAKCRYFDLLMVLGQGSINVSLLIKYELVLSSIITNHQKMLERLDQNYAENQKK